MRNTMYFGVVVVMFTFASCTDNEDTKLEVPESYSFERNGVSTVSYSGQTTRLKMGEELISAMKSNQIGEEALLLMYRNEGPNGEDVAPYSDQELNESTKSIRSKVAASRDFFNTNTVEANKIKAQFEEWMMLHEQEVIPFTNQLAGRGQAGQLDDGGTPRYVSNKGIEYDQLVNKGLIGALVVDQMLNNYLSPAVLDEGNNRNENLTKTNVDGESYTTMEHKWDEAYGYFFGRSDFPTNPLNDLGAGIFLNKYLARVDNDVDFAGIAETIFEAFKKGRAAITVDDYDTRDEQAAIIKEEVNKIIGIRSVYYLQNGKIGLENENWGSAFHDLSEGVGFIYSLRFTNDPIMNESLFNEEEVNQMIDILLDQGFWELTSVELDELSDKIASKFNFTIEEAL